jgi:hypothetical protein
MERFVTKLLAVVVVVVVVDVAVLERLVALLPTSKPNEDTSIIERRNIRHMVPFRWGGFDPYLIMMMTL